VIVENITAALADLDSQVVHRDLKPENVLHLDGRCCLADFSISRYAEASTAPDTRKFGLSAAASTEPSPSSRSTLPQTRGCHRALADWERWRHT
jgi:eukaryotic-like serine/threonine-protein kinase